MREESVKAMYFQRLIDSLKQALIERSHYRMVLQILLIRAIVVARILSAPQVRSARGVSIMNPAFD